MLCISTNSRWENYQQNTPQFWKFNWKFFWSICIRFWFCKIKILLIFHLPRTWIKKIDLRPRIGIATSISHLLLPLYFHGKTQKKRQNEDAREKHAYDFFRFCQAIRMNLLKKTGTTMSIEAKYLEGKARGFKHPAEVAEQLEVWNI